MSTWTRLPRAEPAKVEVKVGQVWRLDPPGGRGDEFILMSRRTGGYIWDVRRVDDGSPDTLYESGGTIPGLTLVRDVEAPLAEGQIIRGIADPPDNSADVAAARFAGLREALIGEEQ